MTNNKPSVILPQSQRLIIDTSAFSPPGYLNKRWRNQSPNQTHCEAEWVYWLNETLRDQRNWSVTCGVRKEIEAGNSKLDRLVGEHECSHNKAHALKRLKIERSRTHEMILDGRVICDSADQAHIGRAWGVYSSTMDNFLKHGGHERKAETDVFLVSMAISYALDEAVYLFSQDIPLLAAYAYTASRIRPRLKKTIIIDENLGDAIHTEKWLRRKDLRHAGSYTHHPKSRKSSRVYS